MEEATANAASADSGLPIAAHFSESAWATFWLALFGFVIPTAAYFYIADRFGFLGPRYNLDLLLICIIGIFAARRAPRLACAFVILGITFVLTIQVSLGLGAIYIDNPALIREYLQFIPFWPWRLISFWLAIAVVALVALYLLLLRVRIAAARVSPFVIVLCIIAALDLAGRTSVGFTLVGENIATSSAVRAFKLGRMWATTEGFTAKPWTVPMTVQDVLHEPTLPPRIVSVAVESFGLFNNAKVNAGIVEPLRAALGDKFELTVGKHDFEGATLSGEMRELCNQRTFGTPQRVQVLPYQSKCLPQILASRGYGTLGIHGNSRFFYNRADVYPALGFRKTLFYDDFIREPSPPAKCKTRAFDGICDSATLRTALDFVASQPKAYAHVMTLDTHFPLGPTALGDDSCARWAADDLQNSDLCLYANQMSNLLAGLGKQLAADKNPPNVVYIFGDHAPPYAVATDRMAFDRKHVPYFVIHKRSSE